jgi:hypothetical protein
VDKIGDYRPIHATPINEELAATSNCIKTGAIRKLLFARTVEKRYLKGWKMTARDENSTESNVVTQWRSDPLEN